MSYKGGGRIEYQKIDDWLTVRYLRINLNQAACFQVELYGCAEGNIKIMFGVSSKKYLLNSTLAII